MTTLADYTNQVQALIHDTNFSDFSQATLTNFINQARVRAAMDLHCVRGFFSLNAGTALNTIPQQENYNYNGTIGGITIVSPGSNYTSPTITISGGGGVGATAQAVVIDGVITEVFMTNWGQGYTSAPSVSISDSTGSGASLSPVLLYNIIDIMSISVLWGDQRIALEWMPFTMFQTYCRQYTNQYDVPGVFTTHNGIQQVFFFQIPDQAYQMEWDYWTLPTPLVNLTDVDNQVIAPYSDVVQFYAASLCHLSLQNLSSSRYFYSGDPTKPGLYDARVRQLFSTIFERRIYNPYRTFASRLRRT